MKILEQAAKVLAEIEEQIAICEAAPKGPWDKSRYHFPDRSVVQRTDGEDNAEVSDGCRNRAHDDTQNV